MQQSQKKCISNKNIIKMNSELNKNLFLVKEQDKALKASHSFDIFNPENEDLLMTCREEKLGLLTKMARFSELKKNTPFNIVIKAVSGEKILSVKRGVSVALSKVEVFDENDTLVGKFKQKLFAATSDLAVFDANDNQICNLKGNWKNWDFKFMKGNEELAQVTKEWEGFTKEFFSPTDSYVLKINDNVAPDDSIRTLILAAVVCFDLVVKD